GVVPAVDGPGRPPAGPGAPPHRDVLRAAPAARGVAVSALPAAFPRRGPRLRPGRARFRAVAQPLRGEGRAPRPGGAAPLVLLQPDALRLGSLRRLLRPARRAGRARADA